MEQQGILDPLNELHLASLHYVYRPRINRALEIFSEGWNNHGIRTARHCSPRQLFVKGVLRLHSAGLTAFDFLDQVEESYGIDGAQQRIYTEDEGVAVPETRISIANSVLQQLQQKVDPLSDSDNHAIELYQRTLEIIDHTSTS